MLLTPAIHVRGLRKSYEQVEAVRGVDLSVGPGEIVAFLGPNGAGKTTILEILEGHRRRDSGDVSVLGFDPERSPRALRERIGIMPQETAVEPVLTVQETVELYTAAYPRPRPVDEVIALVDLEEQRDTRVSSLSGGQQRRLDLAVGIAGDPELLFLDEPTTGFDPGARRNAWQIVDNLSELGKTVFLTTHYMDEAQHLADRVAVIAKGEIVAEGPPSTLGGRHVAETVIRFRRPDGQLPPSVAGNIRMAGEDVEIRVAEATKALHELTSWALGLGIELDGLQVSRPTLEDVYLDLTGGEAGAE